MANDGGGQTAIKSAERVMLIVELLTAYPSGLAFGEILQKLDIPKSSLHGLLKSMEQRGHLVLDDASRSYRLGVRYWEAGKAFAWGIDLAQTAHPHLEAACELLQETVQLAILDGLENVYIAKVEANQPLRLVSRVGSRLPAHATGLGKVLLAYLDENECKRRLAGKTLEKFTEATINDADELQRVLADIRELGYGDDRGEYTPGVFCIAVPVRDHTGQVIAAMSCSVPEVRRVPSIELRMLETLRNQAQGLSEALGFRAAAQTR